MNGAELVRVGCNSRTGAPRPLRLDLSSMRKAMWGGENRRGLRSTWVSSTSPHWLHIWRHCLRLMWLGRAFVGVTKAAQWKRDTVKQRALLCVLHWSFSSRWGLRFKKKKGRAGFAVHCQRQRTTVTEYAFECTVGKIELNTAIKEAIRITAWSITKRE